MSDIQITPFQLEHLAEIGEFLHQNLNRRIAVRDWIGSLTHPWSTSRPNYGVQMRDRGTLVGVFCAIYSEQTIAGEIQRFCNPHSWCVLEPYRSHSIGLVLALIRQTGYHFSMLTPNPKVAEIFRHFKFKDLNATQIVFPNLAWPHRRSANSIVESDQARIANHLAEEPRCDFNLHKDIPWLRFLAVGPVGNACLVVYKLDRWKRLPCARIIHVSDAQIFSEYSAPLRSRLLRDGLIVSKVECRFLSKVPLLAYRMQRGQAKLYLSKTLSDAQIKDLYTELASLDV